MTTTVHILREGLPLCRFNLEVPGRWPEGHKWSDAVWDCTCSGCATEQWKRVGAKTLGVRLEDPSITPEEYNQKTAGWLHERAVGHVRTSMREMTEAEITEEVRMLQSRAWPYAVVCAVKNPFKKEGSPLARTGVIFKDRVSRQTVPHVFKIGVFD